MSDAVQHFSSVSADYAQHRPSYPPALASALAALAPARRLALDVGCGSGQLSLLLAEHFDRVLATDSSAEQIAKAKPHPRITYRCEPAEMSSAEAASVDLVTVAQAAHWFDLPAFYDAVRRIASPGAAIALITYGVMLVEEDIDARFQQFYWHEIQPFWPPERKHVESGYRDLAFPFAFLPMPALSIERDWTLADLLGYLRTWSAVGAAHKARRDDVIERFEADLADIWGDAERRRRVSWPIAVRAGRLRKLAEPSLKDVLLAPDARTNTLTPARQSHRQRRDK
jgi:SAM-dependent methyltransferase